MVIFKLLRPQHGMTMNTVLFQTWFEQLRHSAKNKTTHLDFNKVVIGQASVLWDVGPIFLLSDDPFFNLLGGDF